jgi:tol-pal system protein YbgF
MFGGFMGLKKISALNSNLRQIWFVSFVLCSFILAGCGGGEEATTESPEPAAAKPTATVDQDKPMDQALTNFIGSDSDRSSEPAPSPAVIQPAQVASYEKQVEELRTENTGLKQKIVKLEQENRDVTARLSEVEAKYSAEKMHSERPTGGLVPAPVVAVPSIPAEAEEKAVEVSGITYDDALQAFRTKRYDAAARGFKAIVQNETDEDLVKRSTYWLGETYFAMKKYKEALPLFLDVMNKKGSEKKADAQFMLAQTYDRLGSKAKAKAAYEKVVKNYPMSKNVKRAKER